MRRLVVLTVLGLVAVVSVFASGATTASANSAGGVQPDLNFGDCAATGITPGNSGVLFKGPFTDGTFAQIGHLPFDGVLKCLVPNKPAE